MSGDRIGQWARRGYIRSSQSDGRPRVYSYQDIAEAIVVHELFNRNVSPRAIRATFAGVRDRHGYRWPLQHSELKVPGPHPRAKGKARAVVLVDDQEHIDIAKPHPVLTDEDLVQVAADLERGGWAARELPQLRYIEVDPDRLSGRPVIRGRRVPGEDAGRLAASSRGVEILRDDYDLTDEEIADAREWWRAVQVYEAA